MSNPIAVIFDMDGLMLDTERLELVTCQRAGQELGFPVSESLYVEVVGRTSKDTARIFSEHFGDAFSYSNFRACWRKHTEAYVEEFGVAIKPGLIEMLDLLELHSVPKAVATQTGSHSAAHRLAIVGVGHRFQVLVGGDEVENGKPAPDLYLEAARRLDMLPGHCIALEDSEPGILSAYAAGMIPILIPDMKQPSVEVRQLAHRIFKSLNEAHSFFANLLKSITTQKTLDFLRDL